MKEETEGCPDERTPYERFEDLAKRVLTVPKKDIDEKLAEYEKKKRKSRKRPSR